MQGEKFFHQPAALVVIQH